jgi:hypothetical protein
MADEHAELQERVQDLRQRADVLDRDEREARAARDHARDAHAMLIRRDAMGEQGLGAELAKAERALEKAEAAVAKPWPSQREGLRQALLQAQQAEHNFVVAHGEERRAALDAEAQINKEQVDQAIADLLERYRERQAIETRYAAQLVAEGRGTERTRASRLDSLVLPLERLLTTGGEQAVALRPSTVVAFEQEPVA